MLVKEKYGKFIGDIWPIKDGNNVIYNNGQRWSPSSSSFYSQVLVYIAQMPPDDFTLTLNTANYKTYRMQYYLQALDDVSGTETLDNIKFKMDFEVVANYNYVTYAEDFFDIKGFTKYKSSPSFSGNKIELSNGGTIKFYYKRNQHELKFNNNGDILDSQAVNNVYYGSKLQQYYFVPNYPSNLEPGAYQFGGWYTSPGCYDGSEVDWSNITMPDSDLMLYAKWVPKVHNVRVFLDANKTVQLGETQVVNHRSFAVENVENVSNNGMVFQGWFYVDDGKEKAFVFNAIPIINDVDVYAKWSSHVSVQYKVYYKLKGTNIEVAESTISTAIVGNNKTFPAKAGNELYAAYREGYYPDVNSHTVTMSLTGDREFTFWYTYVEEMPYKVLYIGPNGEVVYQQKIVADNRHSVVTETFQKVPGKMPDVYQKRLVLSTEGEDKDSDGVLDNNVIIFNYNNDSEHAYYRVVHYVQNLTGDSYREFRSEETVGIIGTTYTINPITVNGFKYQYATVNGVKTEANSISAELGAEGMLIELYYNRANVNYIVQYEKKLEDGSFVPVATEKTGIGVFGAQVIEYALDLSANGYELESAQLQMLTLSANSESNVIKFLYKEANVSIKYEVVGPENCGYLSISAENIKAISGIANGSKPTANNGFIFVGWYIDAACTKPVDAALVNDDNKLVPVQQNGVWKAATYYAKFEALQTDLTISTNSVSYNDKDQAFLF
ncbi:MAG: InlB B-repeat-containing protein, partial [Clostridia bacterium]|nr:InlB B-repeat-containing protein [Clostridia bacterium]